MEVEFGDGNPKRGTDTGEVIARLSDKSAAFSDTEVTATEVCHICSDQILYARKSMNGSWVLLRYMTKLVLLAGCRH